MSEFVKGWKGRNRRGDDCEIISENSGVHHYPLLVMFRLNEKDYVCSLTSKGKEVHGGNESGLDLVSNRHPAMDWPVDTKVVVWDIDQFRYNRYFSHAGTDDAGGVVFYCFSDGATSFSKGNTDHPYTAWDFAELWEEGK